MSEKLLIMDIGGSKTRIIVSDIKGNTSERIDIMGLATAYDSDTPLAMLEDALKNLKDRKSITCVAVNLGGKNVEQVRLTVRKVLSDIPLKIFRESEGLAAYSLAEKYDAPIILMAGTGAIAVGHSEKGYVTTGGWGINISDDGSGYDIGLQAIRLTLSALDGVDYLSPMMRCICGRENAILPVNDPAVFRNARDEIREKLFPLERQHIASIAKVVSDFAEKNDEYALEIFKYAGEKLADLVVKTARKLDITSSDVVVTGGLINARKFWADSFESKLPDFKIHYVNDGLLYGTYLIAKSL